MLKFFDAHFAKKRNRTCGRVVDLADLPSETLAAALDNGTVADRSSHWGWSCRALQAYRSGDAESALKYVAKSEEYKSGEIDHARNVDILALAHDELEHVDKAQAALAEASMQISGLKQDPGQKDNASLLPAEIVFREAEAKMGRKADLSDEPATPLEQSTTTPGEKQPNANSDEPDNGDGN